MTTPASENPHWIPEFGFGDKVRKIRRTKGMTQTEFAQALGVGDRAAAAWESVDERMPRDVVSIAKRIELAFGVPAEWLLGLEMRTAPGPSGGPGGSELLPRLDSNQEPSVLTFPQVRRLFAAPLQGAAA